MSCFYCGKRVSMVRKRSDPDFCCDEHREKYHARTRRGIEALREVEERMVVTRRLNEGIPLRPSSPLRGTPLEALAITNPGPPAAFAWMPAGLPVSRARLETYLPAGPACGSLPGQRGDHTLPPLRTERSPWPMGRLQGAPRPPGAFIVTIHLPEGGAARVALRHTACDGPRTAQRAAPVRMVGSTARVVRPRIAWRPAANSIGTLLGTAKPPDPVTPPPPSPPTVVTLRPPAGAVKIARHRPTAAAITMPEAGLLGRRFVPPKTAEQSVATDYARITRGTLAVPRVQIGAGGMSSGVRKSEQRFVPCPEGFRRRQYYAVESLERFCRVGFGTIAGYRPEIRIAATPRRLEHIALAGAWTGARQDPETARPEGRRPAPPFCERLRVPAAIGSAGATGLHDAPPSAIRAPRLDKPGETAHGGTWEFFAALPPVCHQGALSGIAAAAWATGTAEAMNLGAGLRPQTRSARRTACAAAISARSPVFAGPRFVAGRRQAGPTPEKRLGPPISAPVQAPQRSERVLSKRAALLPRSALFVTGVQQSGILERACQAPVGRIATQLVVHGAHRIRFGPALPAGHLQAVTGATLSAHPPARQMGSAFDIARSSPKLLERESLERFRRRGYEGVRSRQTRPTWPACSTPGILKMAAHAPSPHPAHPPEASGAVTMFRAWQPPQAAAFRRACTLMGWGTLDPARPGWTDWGRVSHCASVALPHPLVLPLDRFGPIRDWGLAPPPEPEKPPEPINEDFAGGLANWICANADWRQDIAGVRTGSLALLRPSLGMRDYELEFLGKIENQSVGWVFRAANTSNYHAVRVALDGDHPPQMTRYSVVAGERDPAEQGPLAIEMSRSASCKVKMSVNGDDFKLFLNDQPVAAWSDSRLAEGGIGFFSEGEDRARLYWVKVTPYYDGPAQETYADAYVLVPPSRSETHREIRMGV